MRKWLTKEAIAGFLLGFLPTMVLVFATAASAAPWSNQASKSASLGMVGYNASLTFVAVNFGTGGSTFVGSKNQLLLGDMLFNLQNTSTVPIAATGTITNNIAGLNVLGNLVVSSCSVPWSNPGGATSCSGTVTDSINLGSNVPANVAINYGTLAGGQIKYYRASTLLAIGTMNITATAVGSPGRAGIDRTAG